MELLRVQAVTDRECKFQVATRFRQETKYSAGVGCLHHHVDVRVTGEHDSYGLRKMLGKPGDQLRAVSTAHLLVDDHQVKPGVAEQAHCHFSGGGDEQLVGSVSQSLCKSTNPPSKNNQTNPGNVEIVYRVLCNHTLALIGRCWNAVQHMADCPVLLQQDTT